MRATSRRLGADAEMIERCALNSLIIVMRNADEDTEVGSVVKIEHEPCIFNSLPGGFKEESVLRIDVGSFPWRNTEELRIELIDPVDESRRASRSTCQPPRLGVIISLDVPTVGWHLDDPFTTVDKKFPERIGAAYAAGETATDSDNGNTYFCMVVDCRGRLISEASRYVK